MKRCGTSSETAALRVGQSVDIGMLGRDGCTRIDQRFEFQTDAPTVVTIAMNQIARVV